MVVGAADLAGAVAVLGRWTGGEPEIDADSLRVSGPVVGAPSPCPRSRVLWKMRHDPQGIVLTLAAPVVLVLVFGFVFGPAIAVPGEGDYREFLVPGLFVTIAFNLRADDDHDGAGLRARHRRPVPLDAHQSHRDPVREGRGHHRLRRPEPGADGALRARGGPAGASATASAPRSVPLGLLLAFSTRRPGRGRAWGW